MKVISEVVIAMRLLSVVNNLETEFQASGDLLPVFAPKTRNCQNLVLGEISSKNTNFQTKLALRL